jgi:gas vesicle protein
MSQKIGYTKGLFTGFLGGGAIVALFALLYAPKSGRELRKDIKIKTDKYYDETGKLISDAKLKAKDAVNGGLKIFTDAKSKTDSMITSGKEFIDNEKSKLKTAFKAGVDAYTETKNQNNDNS